MNASVFASMFGEDALAAFENMSLVEKQLFQRMTKALEEEKEKNKLLEEEKNQERAAKELERAAKELERAAKELAQAKERISTVFTRLTNSSPPTLDQYHQLVEDVDFVCAETGLTLDYGSDGPQKANDGTPSATPAGSKKSTSQVTQPKETLPNGFSKIRRANLACDFDVHRWVLSNDDLHQIVLETLFDKDEKKKNTFLEQQCKSLNSFRRVLLYCRSRKIAIREVNDVQPMFHAFLVSFLLELGQHEHRTVMNVNTVRLSVDLSFLTADNTHVEKRIYGFSDIAVYARTSDSNTPKDWSHVFEMKVCFSNLITESGGQAEDQTIVELAAVQGAHLREEFSTNSATDPDSSSSSSASEIPVALAEAPLPISTIEHTNEQDAAAPSNDLPRALEAQAPTKMVLRSHTALARAPSSSLLPTPACSPASTANSSTKEVPRSSINESKINVLGALTDMFELRIACALTNENGENVFFLSDRVNDPLSFVLRIAFLFCEPDAILQHVLRCGDESLDIKCCNSSSPEETKSTKSASQGLSKSGGTNETKAAEDQCRGFYRWSGRAHNRAISPQHMDSDSDSDDSENTTDMFDEESDFWYETSALRQWSTKLYEDLDRGVY